MRRFLPRCCFLLAVIVVAAAGTLVQGETALAQKPRNPTELWEEYPLDSEQQRSPPQNEAPPSGDTSKRTPVVRNANEGTTTDEEFLPLIPIVVALSVILLGICVGVGVLARNPRLRERFDATRGVVGRSRSLYSARGVRPGPAGTVAQVPTPPADGNLSKRKLPPAAKPPTRLKRPSPGKPPKTKPATSTEPVKQAKPLPAKSMKAGKLAGTAGPAKSKTPKRPPKAKKPPKPAQPTKPKPRGATKSLDAEPGRSARERATDLFLVRRPSSHQAPSRPTGPSDEKKLTCSIFGSRNDRIADFYALASGTPGREWIVERSPSFEWLAGEPPAEAYEAHAILVDQLQREGWRLVGVEGAWYRQCFELPVDVPASD
jgi:hypothetical protein